MVRDYSSSPALQYRILESFWDSQIRSKAWLINSTLYHFWQGAGNVYIYGGWFGTLGRLIKEHRPNLNIYSIDIDPECERIGNLLNPGIQYITGDMQTVIPVDAKLIINTSTEHVTQDVYDRWLLNMPENVPIVLQGNDYFDCAEHVRCSLNLEQFKEQSKLTSIVYAGTLQCVPFKRFMIIGYKNAI